MDEITQPTQDERLLAGIAHTGIFTLLGTLIIWLTQKDKSKYVGFQARQALIYQISLSLFYTLGFIISFILMFVLIGFLLLGILGILAVCTGVYGFYGAYKCWKGEDFRYVMIGDMLSK